MTTGTWSIVRTALAQAPAGSRWTAGWLVLASAAMLALQVWDVWGRVGPPAVAEMLSVAVSVGGVMLLGLATTLGAGGAVLSRQASDPDYLTPVLRTLPPLAFLSGILLSAGIALFVARGLLGLHPARVIVPAAIQGLALYAAWITVRNTTALLFDHAQRQATQAIRARADLADAKLGALQARMQPHFLFNALNTVASLVKTDPDAAERTVEDLAAILRGSLKRGESTTWPLREEVALARAFVGVEQRRLGNRLAVAWSIAPETLETAVPVLSLQPLIENAITHGIAPRMEGGAVAIAAERLDGAVRLIVTDDGDGFRSGWRNGIGLGNLGERLASLYGGRGTLTVQPGPPATVSFVVPDVPS